MTAWNESIGLLRAFLTEQMADQRDLRPTKASIALLLVDALTNTDPAELDADDMKPLSAGLELLEQQDAPDKEQERELFKQLLDHHWNTTPSWSSAEFADALAATDV